MCVQWSWNGNIEVSRGGSPLVNKLFSLFWPILNSLLTVLSADCSGGSDLTMSPEERVPMRRSSTREQDHRSGGTCFLLAASDYTCPTDGGIRKTGNSWLLTLLVPLTSLKVKVNFLKWHPPHTVIQEFIRPPKDFDFRYIEEIFQKRTTKNWIILLLSYISVIVIVI